MSKIKKIEKERKFFRREFIPVFCAFGLLIILVIGLVYFLNNKPDGNGEVKLENTLAAEEITVGSSNDYCEGYNIDDMRREANKVVLTYGVEENILLSQGEDTDNDPNDPEIHLIDEYGDGLRININYLTENLKIKIIEHNASKDTYSYNDDLDKTQEFSYYDADEKGVVSFVKKDIPSLTYVTVRIYMKDPVCNNLLLREFETVFPRSNTLVEHPVCQHELFKDSDECEKLVFYDADIDDEMDDIYRMTKKIREQENKSSEEENKKTIIDSRVIYLLAVIPVIIVVIIIRKGRRKHVKKDN